MLVYFLGSAPLFVVLCVSVEGLFYSCYAAVLYFWTLLEPALSRQTLSNYEGGSFSFDRLRISVFFLFFTQVAFFGTGK
jgi:phosphatidylinositol glycan class N